jgi:hypothetical protein
MSKNGANLMQFNMLVFLLEGPSQKICVNDEGL